MAARISDALRVPRRAVDLRRIDPGATPRFKGGRAAARKATEKVSPRLAHLQERLFAEGRKGGTRSHQKHHDPRLPHCARGNVTDARGH